MAAGNRRREKDQEMARALKGVERTTGCCPICYRIVPNGDHPGHCTAPTAKALVRFAPRRKAA